jgi:hypothetical protein
VILVLAVVMAATIAVALVVLRRVGDRAEGRADTLRDEVERRGESWEIPLAGAAYQSGDLATRSKGRGVLGLTDRRVLFLPIAGEHFGVLRGRITGARLEGRRRDAAAVAATAAGHRRHLVLTLDDETQLGFLVDDGGEWEAALTPAASGHEGDDAEGRA